MKIIPLVYPSAMQFWLNVEVNTDSIMKSKTLVALPDHYQIPDSKDFIPILEEAYSITMPAKLQLPNEGIRVKRKDLVSSIRSSHVPGNCFLKITNYPGKDELYVACPEYCFLKAASKLSFQELVLLGFTICAKYISDETAEYRQRSRNPITSQRELSKFLGACAGSEGVKKARRALAYILDNSNSPKETQLAMAYSFPFFLGGGATGKPTLNKPIHLSQEGKEFLGYDTCYGDFVWEKEKVIVEYDSDLTHLESQQHARDKRRSTALALSGYKVISITKENIMNFSSYEQMLLAIRTALKLRPLTERFEKYREERYDLYHFLLREEKNLIRW